MAEEYGKLPTEVASIYPGEYTRVERFRINRDIFYATTQKKDEGEQDSATTSGVGTAQERDELIENQEQRANSTHGSLADQMESI